MKRTWIALVGLTLASGLGFLVFRLHEARQVEAELERARGEVRDKAFAQAGRRLSALASRHPHWDDGEIDYWLGVCSASQDRHKLALESLKRVPPRGRFGHKAAILRAASFRALGQLRHAEDVLTEVQSEARGDMRIRALNALERLYQMEVRVDEIRQLLCAELESTPGPEVLVHKLWMLDWGAIPPELIRRDLDRAEALAPVDDRVWLGRARLALLQGDVAGAEELLRKCVAVRVADEPVWRAWLDWQPVEISVFARFPRIMCRGAWKRALARRAASGRC